MNNLEDSVADEIDDYQEGDIISKNLIKHLVVYFDENEIDISRAFTELDADEILIYNARNSGSRFA